MKTRTLVAAVLLALAGLSVVPAESKAQGVSVNFSVFHSELSRYGRWVQSPRFGQVWIYNEPDFRPYYTNGRWDYTDYGWAWVSDYDWGWAPFHYGRWEYDLAYGWIWIPGYEWAPAWVSWSESGDYYGWAPMGHGWSVNVSLGSIPYDRWVFVSRPYMNSPRFRDYCAPVVNNRVIIRNTTIINNVYTHKDMRYYSGPGRRDVERYSRGPINPRQIDNDRAFRNRNWGYTDDRMGQNDRRPQIGTPDREDRRYGDRIDRRDRRNDNREWQGDQNGRNNDRDWGRGRQPNNEQRPSNRQPVDPAPRNGQDRELRREYPGNGRIARERQMRDNGSQGRRDQPATPPDRRGFGQSRNGQPGAVEQREPQRQRQESDQRRVDRRQDRSDIGQGRVENRNNNGNNQQRGNGNGSGRERGNRNGRGPQQ